MFGKDVVVTSGAYHAAVGGVSAQVAADLLPGVLYAFTTNIGCWIKQGFGVQTAAKAASNFYVPAGGYTYLHGSNGTHLSQIQDSSAGLCSLAVITEI